MRRVAEAVGGSIDSAAGLPEFQRELLEHVRSMDAGIQTLVRDIADVKASLGPSATGQFEQLQECMTRVEALVSHIDDQIPDPDAPSPIAKAKDASWVPIAAPKTDWRRRADAKRATAAKAAKAGAQGGQGTRAA